MLFHSGSSSQKNDGRISIIVLAAHAFCDYDPLSGPTLSLLPMCWLLLWILTPLHKGLHLLTLQSPHIVVFSILLKISNYQDERQFTEICYHHYFAGKLKCIAWVKNYGNII